MFKPQKLVSPLMLSNGLFKKNYFHTNEKENFSSVIIASLPKRVDIMIFEKQKLAFKCFGKKFSHDISVVFVTCIPN